MFRYYRGYLLVLFVISLFQDGFAHQLGKIKDHKIIVSDTVDLKGSTVKLPNNYTLVFKGGLIKNGTLVGNKTKILSSGKSLMRVSIKGTWNVQRINSSLFADLSYENSLKDVLALADPKVQNTIIIEKGVYQVTALKLSDICLSIPSNTTLILDGSIRLRPNAYPRYDIIRVKGDNIHISGRGCIIGDKHSHLGDKGEWGMGVRFHEATNASIEGLTIRDCWGDCIYVGGNSKNIIIKKCTLDHGRRQGISVTKADHIVIKSCKISNVGGTNPEYAIDLEPNANDTVDHILIENVEVVDCGGGFLATIGKKDVEKKKIGKVQIRNCKVSALSKYPIRMICCDSLFVENCIINTRNENSAVYTRNAYSVVVRNNVINVKKDILLSVKNTVKEVVGKKGFVPINIIQAEKQEIKDNKIVER